MNKHLLGIFGGTFDPIHLGHLHLATTVYKLCNLEKVLVVPNYQSPLRAPSVASPQDRFNMVQLAIKNRPHFVIESFEIDNQTTSYTIKTLHYLRQKYHATPLGLIMGIDVFNRLDEWYEWQKIFDLTHILIAKRPTHGPITNKKMAEVFNERATFDLQQLQNKTAGLVYLIEVAPLAISATEIRALIKGHQDASHLLTPEVWQYINDNKLYT